MLRRKNRSSRNSSFFDHLAKVAVGGAEDADVDPERLVLAHAADLAGLEEPQQLDLHALVELADLVEEERAAVGDLEEPLAVGIGAGEGPLAMAEELALDQVLGQGAAVDRDERAAGAIALVVEAARDQLLAGAGLAQDHDGGVGGGDRVDQAADLLHGRCLADQKRSSLGGLEPGLQGRGLVGQVAALGRSGCSKTSSSAHLHGLVR